VRRHTLTEERVELDVVLSQRGFVRLAYGYWPYTDVSVDGVVVQPMETEDRFTALELDAGAHLVVLQHRLSPLRQVLLWLAVAISLATAWCFFLVRRSSSITGTITDTVDTA
jgi:hypothetical protein